MAQSRLPLGTSTPCSIELSVHVHLVDAANGGRVIDQEEAGLPQARLLSHLGL